jgi:glycosyltransferase involved in cell wall biosynthesis
MKRSMSLDDMQLPGVMVVSRANPSAFGGLPGYIRGIARAMTASGSAVVRVATTTLEGECPEGLDVVMRPRGDLFPKVWMRMASRPVFHRLMESMIVRAETPWLRNMAPEGLKAVLWVGTGWDFWGFSAARLARERGIRFAVWPAVHPGRWGDDRIDIRLYRMADVVFSQSAFESRHLASQGVEPTRLVRCALPPLCSEEGDAGRFLAGHVSRPVVLFIGRRNNGKGYTALLEAWAAVRTKHPTASLIVMGPGPVNEEMREGVIELESPDEMVKADGLAACDVFCLPSAEESFGIAYAEAWSYGKPVVCGTAPAAREWVRDGERGLACDGSPQGIAESLLRLLADLPLRLKLGDAGRKLQRTQLTWPHVLETHKNVLFGHA